MPEKPSKNEDEYFARRDAELLQTARTEQIKRRETEEREKHKMKCPRCGGNLTTVQLHSVEVDICPEGHGTWLDAGELELLVKHEEPGLLRRVFADVVSGIRGKKESK